MIAHALVDTFIMACEDDEVALERKFVGDVLVEAFAIGRGEDHFVVIALGLEGCDTAVDGLALHHHTGRAAIGVIINSAPFVEGVVTEVVQTDFCQSFLLSPCQDGFVDEAFQHLGQNGYDVYSHIFRGEGLGVRGEKILNLGEVFFAGGATNMIDTPHLVGVVGDMPNGQLLLGTDDETATSALSLAYIF